MRLVQQRGIGDCGIAALASFLGQSYEDIYNEMAKRDKHRGKLGTTFRRLILIAAALGVQLRLRLKFDLDESEGLLAVEWLRKDIHPHRQHVVVLYHGLILDPADGEVLDADEYLTKNEARAMSMLEVRK
jgi:ABC-type bacteriocin/lantibiotic exporter with double-glycine peptidase domain